MPSRVTPRPHLLHPLPTLPSWLHLFFALDPLPSSAPPCLHLIHPVLICYILSSPYTLSSSAISCPHLTPCPRMPPPCLHLIHRSLSCLTFSSPYKHGSTDPTSHLIHPVLAWSILYSPIAPCPLLIHLILSTLFLPHPVLTFSAALLSPLSSYSSPIKTGHICSLVIIVFILPPLPGLLCSHLLHQVLTCSTMSSPAPPCTHLLHHVLTCSTMSSSASPCPHLLHHVLTSAIMSSPAPPCPHLLHHVLICFTMSSPAPPCPHLLHHVLICFTMSSPAPLCPHLLHHVLYLFDGGVVAHGFEYSAQLL